MNGRTEYPVLLTINGRQLSRVIIDQYYKEKHPDVTDAIILELIKQLDGQSFRIELERDGFQYFRAEPVFHNEAPYRMVLLLCVSEDYLGVINTFRVRREND